MADVKYKTAAEINAALEAISPKFDQFQELNGLTLEYNNLDPYAADAAEQRSTLSARAKPIYEASSQDFWNNIHPEVIEIAKSINALPNKFGFNSDRDALLAQGARLNNLDTIADKMIVLFQDTLKSTKAKLKEVQDAKARGENPTPPATTAEPTPASATDTAANQVSNTNPQSAAPAGGGGNAVPPNVPENQLSGAQRNNLIKSQSGQGGAGNADDAGTTPAPGKSEATSSDRVTSKIPIEAMAIRQNRLHQYPSYTYALSLHLLDKKTFNDMVDSGEYSAANVLIASAGRWNEATGAKAFNRNSRFKEDFYFEDLEIETVIGLGETNRATNAIDVKFTLIEPYGFTFIDRLMNASKDLGILNYAQNPYMLQIDFYATEDDGTTLSPIPGLTKNIPISIRTCDVDVTAKGSEYKITCTPFNHQAFDYLVTQAPINVEVVAQTVEGFFKSSEAGTSKLTGMMISDENQRAEHDAGIADIEQRAAMNNTVVPLTARLKPVRYSKDSVYTTQSYGDVLNANQQAIRYRQGLRYVDRYQFKFDKEIGEAQLIKDERISPSDRPMKDLIEAYAQGISGSENSYSAFGSKDIKTNINYGSSVDAIISRTVRNSTYILNQLNDITNQVSQKKYQDGQQALEEVGLNWYKIIPSIKLLGFDPYTNTWAREITYHVVPYRVYNVNLEDAPQRKATTDDCVKYYDYIYTGTNNDILDLKLNFNATYYVSVTAYKENLNKLSGTNMYYDTGTSCDVIKPLQTKSTVQPKQIRYKLTDQRDMASSRTKSAKEITAANLERSLHVDARADMLSCTIRIIGDPEFIKQDDLFIKPNEDSQGYIVREWDTTRTKNGSIKTDNGEVYINLTFKTPVDVNDETGMMKFSEERTSVFSGIYKILEVRSYFNRGQFTQDLVVVRIFDQEPENAPSTERSADSTPTLTPGNQGTETPSPEAAEQSPSEALPEAQDENNESQPEPEPVPDPMPIPEQPDLSSVRDNAPETPINQNSEPRTVAPPPNPNPPLPAGVTQDPVSGNFLYKGVTIPNTGTASMQTIVSAQQAIDNKSVVTYTYPDPVTGTVATRTFDGATAVANQQATSGELGKAQSAYDTALESLQHTQSLTPNQLLSTQAQYDQIVAIKQARVDAAKAAILAARK